MWKGSWEYKNYKSGFGKRKKKEKKKFQAEHKLKLLCFIASATTKKQAKEAVKLGSELRI